MLNGEYKNLRVDPTFLSALNEVVDSNTPTLTEDLLEEVKVLKEKFSQPTYIGARHQDILDSFKSVVQPEHRYDEALFKLFEREVLD